ncbi:MFS transporter [Pseudomonas sp. NPDC090202]|uniref:MFS transporter n=1 Tax=unclassified Pseudomonas TaxID=196821 RepID=UPI00381D0C9E
MNDLNCPSAAPQITRQANTERRRALFAGCGAHAIHDGLTDVIYVLLPLWQAQFALSYAQVGLLRGAYSAMMAGFQLLASRAARRWGRKRLLVGGTVLAALAYLLIGAASGLGVLLVALLLGGLGASSQHPLASSLITDAYEAGGGIKQALSQYNFAGDIGKTLVPGLVGLSLTVLSWRASAIGVGMLGMAVAVWLWWMMPSTTATAQTGKGKVGSGAGSVGGLRAMIVTGTLDSAVRMGFLTFLPFLLQAKGAGSAGIGLALTLLFIGGAFGKLLCGYLGARIGMMKTVWLTEFSTAVLILLALWLPYTALMAVLPLLGLALNGTSSVLYGAVPDLAGKDRRDHAFSLFYTGTIGGGAIAPVLFGRLGDLTGIPVAVTGLAALLLLTLPLAWYVQKGLDQAGSEAGQA